MNYEIHITLQVANANGYFPETTEDFRKNCEKLGVKPILIETQNINTQVLVGNGETAVLGGIFEQTVRNDVEKVPFFGDLPIMGNLFKKTTKQNDKQELLIFITPKIMDESLSLR